MPKIMVVGLDIEENHLMGAAISKKGEQISLVASEIYELPAGTIQNGELKNPQALKEAVRSLVKKIPSGRFSPADPTFILSIPPNHIYTETAFFPPLRDLDLTQSVHLKIETSLPWPIDNAYVDWSRIAVKNSKDIGIFIAAISKPILDEYFRVFLEEGWRIGACEFHLFSLTRFVSTGQTEPFIFVLVDEDGIEFAVSDSVNMLVHSLEQGASLEKDKDILENKIRQLTSFVDGNYGIKVKKIFLFDKVSWEKTSANITNITGIPTQVFIPAEGQPIPDFRLAIAYGAVGRPYMDEESLMNLTPPALGGRYRENLFLKTIDLWGRIGFVFVATFLLALAATFIFLSRQLGDLKNNVANFTKVLDQKTVQAAPLFKEATYFNRLQESILRAKGFRTDVGKRLNAVENQAIKSGLSLAAAHGGGERRDLVAVFTAQTRAAVLNFEEEIKANHLFSAATIPLNQLAPAENLTVTVSFQP